MMNMLTIILGLLVGLVASILVGVTMTAAKILSIGRDSLAIKKAPKKRVQPAPVSAARMPQLRRCLKESGTPRSARPPRV